MPRWTRALGLATLMLLLGPGAALAKSLCATIPQGVVGNSLRETIRPGYDEWGYNYQARLFNGGYCDAYRNAAWCQPYADVELSMKWNDAWLSNQDCTGDGLLDRHRGFASYRGSGAWLTNHMRGPYVDPRGRACEWTTFTKIVAAPAKSTGVYVAGGGWYNAAGEWLGQVIWAEFIVVQDVYNDPCEGSGGLVFKGARPGVGNWDNPAVVD